VTQGRDPPGAGASVLSHLLGTDETVREGMGLFLEETCRLRPEVSSFISDTLYEGRLQPAEVCTRRSLAAGNDLLFVAVDHHGNRTQSPEEAEFVRDEIGRLLGTPYTDEERERSLREDDVIVVAPYNAQVRYLRQELPDRRIRIGDGRQVPRPAGGRGLLLDGELKRRRCPPWPRLPLLATQLERRDLAREMPCLPHRKPAPP
jgi:AAA domain